MPNYIEARMETGISTTEYNELFWGPNGEDNYDVALNGPEEIWERINREYTRTEYYNPNINFGVRDSILRENGNIYEPQVNEVINELYENNENVCSCGWGTRYQVVDS